MLASDLSFGHGLLFGQCRNHLVTCPLDGISIGADRLCRGQGEVLEDAHSVLRVGLN